MPTNGIHIFESDQRANIGYGLIAAPLLSALITAFGKEYTLDELALCPSLMFANPWRAYEFSDDFFEKITGRYGEDHVGGTLDLGDGAAVGLGGVGVLATGGADNDRINIKLTSGTPAGASFKITKDNARPLIFEAKLALSSVIDCAAYIGLCDAAATRCGADDTGARAMTDGVYFRVKTDAPTELDWCVCKNGVETEVKAALAAVAADDYAHVAFYFDGVNTVTPVIGMHAETDWVVAADAVNFPNDVALTFHAFLLAGEAQVKKLYMDRYRVGQMRI